MRKVLSIAGSSSRGGAGMQADLIPFQELEVYGMAAITAIVTISDQKGRHIFPQSLESLEAQVLTASERSDLDAIKTGMIYSEEQVQYVVDVTINQSIPRVIVDPVIVTKSGAEIVEKEAIHKLKNNLLPLATIVTPNTPEAEKLSGLSRVDSVEKMKEAANIIHSFGPKYVIVKGGRLTSKQAVDVLFDGKQYTLLATERIPTDTNGAGCTFSAAIAAELSKGHSVFNSVKTAKEYITGAIAQSITFKGASSRINHTAHREIAKTHSPLTIASWFL